jgi:hypothetical protein
MTLPEGPPAVRETHAALLRELDSLQQGVGILEVVLDDEGIQGLVFMEATAALRQRVDPSDPFLIETLGRVARSGEPTAFGYPVGSAEVAELRASRMEAAEAGADRERPTVHGTRAP